jgi:hypothetical protein
VAPFEIENVRRAHGAAHAVLLFARRLWLGFRDDVHADEPAVKEAADFQRAPGGELKRAELRRIAVASEQAHDLASLHFRTFEIEKLNSNKQNSEEGRGLY